MSHTIAVLGSGSWGTALAVHLARTGHDVRLWARDHALASTMASVRENAAYLPGISLPRGADADLQHPGRREWRVLRRDGGAVAWPA